MTTRKPCGCRSHAGQPKRSYASRRAAVSVAIRRGWAPSTYRCPKGRGWHLTHG